MTVLSEFEIGQLVKNDKATLIFRKPSVEKSMKSGIVEIAEVLFIDHKMVRDGRCGAIVSAECGLKARKNRTKLRVGKDYPVQRKANEAGLWWCDYSGVVYKTQEEATIKRGDECVPIPLRYRVLAIRDKQVSEMTNREAEAYVGEGFKYPRRVLFIELYGAWAKKIPTDKIVHKNGKYDCEKTMLGWNPFIWLVEVEAIKYVDRRTRRPHQCTWQEGLEDFEFHLKKAEKSVVSMKTIIKKWKKDKPKKGDLYSKRQDGKG